MDNLDFTPRLIKGKIAEVIFEQMFRESEQYTILHTGYEYTLPELAQYKFKLKKPEILGDVQNSPDFVLISKDKTEVYFVEVKYEAHLDKQKIQEISEKLIKGWHSPYLFVATPNNFYFEPCHSIVKKQGDIGTLHEKWALKDRQDEYLKLLRDFESRRSE